MRQGILLYLEHLVPLPILDIIHLSILYNCILSIFHYLGSPLSCGTLIFDLRRNIYIHNACTYSFYSYKICTCVILGTSTCRAGQKRCANGQCLSDRKWCDFIYDCVDHSDELACGKIDVC